MVPIKKLTNAWLHLSVKILSSCYQMSVANAAVGEPEKAETEEKAEGKSAPQCVLYVGDDSVAVVQCSDCSKPFCDSHGKVCQSCQVMLQRQFIHYNIVQYPKISQA